MIAGLAYELIRYAGKHQGDRVLMTLLAPGLWLQRLTTREPSLDQLEVSIRALREVLEQREGGGEASRRGHGVVATERRAEVTWRGSLLENPDTIGSTTSGAFGGLGVTWKARSEDRPAA